MRHGLTTSCLGLVAFVVSCGADAHHSFFGRFDRTRMIEIEGTVTEVSWRNPHTVFRVDSGDTEWEVELSSATLLGRLGIERSMIQPGDTVRFAGFPPVTERREVYARHALLENGRELLFDSRIEPRWKREAIGAQSILTRTEGDSSRPDLGIFRVWTLIRSGQRLFPEVVDPSFDIDSYPMTESARAALAAFDRIRDNPTRNCAPKGMPTIMEQPYPIEFEQLENGELLLHIEEYDLVRRIHMGNETSNGGERTLLGFSRGRWEGETLVVTTTNVDWPYFDQLGIPQSDRSVLVERFTPMQSGARLDYELTVNDPVNFTVPVVLKNYWIWVPETVRVPYECTVSDGE
jgi:hypothetical protein